MDGKHVWVADPGAGKLKYTREEFCRCWISARKEGEDTGVALLLEPTPEFYAQEDEKETAGGKGFGFLYSYLKPYKQLEFKGELAGTAEVMTDERSVTARLPSPLRYLWEKYL